MEKDRKPEEVQPEIEGDTGYWFWVCGACHCQINWHEKECPTCKRRVNWDG